MAKLNINVRSFSYKKGIPTDPTGNGGGFVFDCRGILNPGRIEKYKTQTGRDEEVKKILGNRNKNCCFLNWCFSGYRCIYRRLHSTWFRESRN